MKRILVPTDFSRCAINALNFAIHSASYLPLEIHILHSFDTQESKFADYVGNNKEFNETMLSNAQANLDRIQLELEEKKGLTVFTHLSCKPFIESVIEYARENKTELIIMGTLGGGGLKEKIWGTNTGTLIGKSTVPVLAIPASYHWKKPEKFLLATNHFENDPEILDFLFETADLYLAEMQVMVFTEEEGDPAFAILEHTRKTPMYEKMLKEQYSQDTLTATHLFGNEFEESLLDFIKLNQVDVLAMITYPRSFLERVFHPSLTKRLSYHIQIPLLAIPAKTGL